MIRRLITILALAATPAWAEPIISEFMADNVNAQEDNKKLYSDWIELHNPAQDAVTLTGYTIVTDKSDLDVIKANLADPNRPDKKAVGWTFPADASLAGGAYMIIWCSGFTVTDIIAATTTSPTVVHHHTNFQLSSNGEYLALVNPKGEVVSEVPAGPGKTSKYADQYENTSYGQVEGKWGYMETPTPGLANAPVVAEPPSKVEISVKGKTFTDAFKVELSHPDTAAQDAAKKVEIRYTTDGTSPAADSTLYTGPIDITATTHLRARAFYVSTKGHAGRMNSENYIQIGADLVDTTNNIGLVIIDTFGLNVDSRGKTPKNKSMLAFIEPDEKTGRASVLGAPSSVVYGGIARRGESSLDMFQKQYGVEIWDELNQDKATKLVGGYLPESDFALYGPATDKTLMRNYLSYGWFAEMGNYAVKTRYMEMYMCPTKGQPVTKSHYRGVYLLVERLKRDKNRVDLDELLPQHQSEPEISGSYIFRKDKEEGVEHLLWNTAKERIPLQLLEPELRTSSKTVKNTLVPAHQATWIKNYINSFETALYSADMADPVNGYAKYIDVDNFIDAHILVETTKQIDGYRLSNYMAKDRNGKIFCLAWDYNLSLGNADYLDGWKPAGWYYLLISGVDYPWYKKLFSDPEFSLRYQDRWFSLRRGMFATSAILKKMTDTHNLLAESAERHYVKYKRLGVYDWPNAAGFANRKTYAAEVDFMKNWVERRVMWMDRQFEAPVQFSVPGGVVNPGTEVAFAQDLPEVIPPAPVPGQTALDATKEKYPVKERPGKIYYTTDGSDPRLRGGGVNPSAKVYDAPIAINSTTRIKARLIQDSGGKWTAINEATYVVGEPASARNLIVSEVMFNPPGPSDSEKAAGFTDGEQFEFIELLNVGKNAVQLGGAKFTNGVEFDFNASAISSVPAGERILIVSNKAAFEKRYGTALPVAGQFSSGNLRNTGERVTIEGVLKDDPITPVAENVVATFKFNDGEGWPAEADGQGASLVRKSEGVNEDLALAANWKKGAVALGSPGKAEPAAPVGGDYAAWKKSVFSEAELANDAVSGDTKDGDSDGLTTFMEFCLNTNPKAADRSPLQVASVDLAGSRYPTFTFPMNKSANDVKFLVEVSDNLKDWNGGDAYAVKVSVQANGNTDWVTYRGTKAVGGSQYLRLKVSK